MSDPAMLLGEAIRVLASMTPRPPNLIHACNLLREAKGSLEAALARVATDHAGVSFTGSLSHSVQVTDAMVYRFLERLCDLRRGYVTPVRRKDGAYVIDGIWSTEDLRAALVAALGQK